MYIQMSEYGSDDDDPNDYQLNNVHSKKHCFGCRSQLPQNVRHTWRVMKDHLHDPVYYCSPVCWRYHPYYWQSAKSRDFEYVYHSDDWQTSFEDWYRGIGFSGDKISLIKSQFHSR